MNQPNPNEPTPYLPGPNPDPSAGQNQAPQWSYPPPMQYRPVPAMVKPKNPGAAAVLSFLIPGLGQMMNGDIALGICMMVLVFLAWMSLFIVIGFLALPAVYIWSIVEAYNTAKKWNMAHGIIS